MDTMTRRFCAIQEAMDEIRSLGAAAEIDRSVLEAMKQPLIALAARSDLFPDAHFSNDANNSGAVYALAKDPDCGFALYAATHVPGKPSLPHDHTTWAITTSIRDRQCGVFHKGTGDEKDHRSGTLVPLGEKIVHQGEPITLIDDKLHSTEALDCVPCLHLHLYGNTIPDLPRHITFESPAGGAISRLPAKPETLAPWVPASELKAMIGDGQELAILDVREEGVFARGHIFFAACLPLSNLEMRLNALVPRRSVRLVLCDDGEGLAQAAATKLRRFGYENIAVLAGGVSAWRQSGFEVFKGVCVPGKALGEYLEQHDHTPSWSAERLSQECRADADVVILDSRPFEEFRRMSIPGGINCPASELVRRVFEMVKRPETTIVVNCAGRTRSIIGAQALIDAGVPNQVVALEDGAIGWHLAGLKLDHAQKTAAPDPGPEGLARAKAAADALVKRFGIEKIGLSTLRAFEAQRDSRALYLFDVRTAEEYEAGHFPGALNVAGGQLTLMIESFVSVRNARIVLIDSEGVRAVTTASWLVRMGWGEVYTLIDESGGPERGPYRAHVFGLDEVRVADITPDRLSSLLRNRDAVVIDLASSQSYQDRHIPGAMWMIRSRLPAHIAALPPGRMVVFTSWDGIAARLAAADAMELFEGRVLVLKGGTSAWLEAGLPLASGEEGMMDAAEDMHYSVFLRKTGVEDAMRRDMQGQKALVEQIARDPDIRFKDFPVR